MKFLITIFLLLTAIIPLNAESDSKPLQLQQEDHFTIKTATPISLSFTKAAFLPMPSIPARRTKPKYDTWVQHSPNKSSVKGYLHRLGDSAIWFGSTSIAEIEVSEVYKLKFRGSNAPLAAIGGGFGLGFFVGTMVGVGIGEGLNEGGTAAWALGTGILFALGGIIIGGILGQIQRVFKINGQQSLYDKYKSKLAKYVVQKRG